MEKGLVGLCKFAFNQSGGGGGKGFNAKLVAETSRPHTLFTCAKHTRSWLQSFIAQSILISWSIRDNKSAPPSFSRSPDGVIEGCKEEDVSVCGLLPHRPPTTPTRTALKCLWVFMIVVFYGSGQEPGAVKECVCLWGGMSRDL